MTGLTTLFIGATIVAAFLTSLAIWSPRRVAIKLGALAAAFLFLPLTYASLGELLSRPKPVAFEWWQDHAQEANVLGSTMHEGEGIYLWLQLPDVDEPRSYKLPWSQEMAENLQEARREAEENQSGVRMRLPFESTLDDREPRFYAMPQPALPPKDGQNVPAQRYQAPTDDA